MKWPTTSSLFASWSLICIRCVHGRVSWGLCDSSANRPRFTAANVCGSTSVQIFAWEFCFSSVWTCTTPMGAPSLRAYLCHLASLPNDEVVKSCSVFPCEKCVAALLSSGECVEPIAHRRVDSERMKPLLSLSQSGSSHSFSIGMNIRYYIEKLHPVQS